MKKYAYYPGCTLGSTGVEYGLSAMAVCEKLGIEMWEIPDYNCCGASSAHLVNPYLALGLAARNMAIAEEGIRGNYGANIGSVLLDMEGDNLRVKAKAMAAAGSDARMNGCEQPVVINSGSGNQGITSSVPVIVYARAMEVGEEKMLRALTLSNLTTIHEKTPIGRLSAYCGAVSAGAGAGAGIAYLCGGDYDVIAHTVVNALAIVSGIVCDGAKASCAAKIATAVEAGIFGYNMYIRGQEFYGGDGIVAKGIETSLKNVGRLGKEGMKETNEEIIKIMIEG